jgi:hypothetical protein
MSFALVAWAMEQDIESATQKWVLVALANVANHHTGECRPKMETLARETSLGESTVRKAVTALVKGGYVKRKRQRRQDGSLGVYEFEFPEAARERRPPLDASADPPLGDSGHEPGKNLEPERGSSHPSASPRDSKSPPPPKLTKIGGRDIAFDALARACRIEEQSPRMREVGQALSGDRRAKGIREQFWRELIAAGLGVNTDATSWAQQTREAFEYALAKEIERRVEMYRHPQGLGEATLTPRALAKWWSDLPGMVAASSIQTFHDHASAAVDRARRRHAG